MNNMFLANGRLAWPPVLLFAFMCANIVMFDLIWRTFTISAEALLLCAGLVLIIGSVVIVGVGRMKRTAQR